jgi:1-acyl-sn-glycerol-3-phosphate acyltransferase
MLRIVAVASAIALVTAALAPVQFLAVALRLPVRRWIPPFYHRLLCVLLGVRVRVVGERHIGSALLIVSNHVSWLDIPVITSRCPVVFVAKREVSTWPLFGQLAKLQRTVFVDRTRRHKTAEVNAQIAARLAEGDPVVLFGEGTSSDGNRVLAFRSALIGAARDALAEAEHADRVWLQPLSVAYTHLHGLPMGRQHRGRVAWYGDLDLMPHLGEVIRGGAIDVTVTWGPPVAFDIHSGRKAVTRALEGTVRRLTGATLRGRPASA